MAKNIARTVVDVGGPILDAEDLAFIADGTANITVTGCLWCLQDAARVGMHPLISNQFAFTFTLGGSNARRLFDATPANAISGLAVAPTGFVAATLNFSAPVRYGVASASALLTDMGSNKARYPLLDANLSNRTFGRLG